MKSVFFFLTDSKQKIGEAEAGGIIDAVFFGARFAEVDGDDGAGHWILGDVDGGFGFFAEVAAHFLLPEWCCSTRFRWCLEAE